MSKPVDLTEIPARAERFRKYISQFESMFVGKSWSIRLLSLALLTREHILLAGPPGIAKTQLCDAVFDGIIGAKSFRTEVSGYTGEDGLLGPYNVKRLREDGRLEHNIEDMLPEAKFARIGEFLDANGVTLRALLGIMNERRLLKGPQNIQVPLMTAYLDTNKDPAAYLRKNPDAWAVLDRVLFLEQLGYLDTPDAIEEMVTRYQRGASRHAKIQIDVEDIEVLSSMIVNPPGLITDSSILQTYAQVINEYRTRRRELPEEERKLFILPEISDRRVNKASMVMEAEAILNGRLTVIIDDLMSAGVALCTSLPERNLWAEIVQKYTTEHKKRSETQVSNAQGLALKAIAERLQTEVLSADPAVKSDDLVRVLQVLKQQLATITPTTDEVHVLHEEVTRTYKTAVSAVKQKTQHETGLDTL